MFIAILDGHYCDEMEQELDRKKNNLSFTAWFMITIKKECEEMNTKRKKVKIFKIFKI